MSTEEIEVWKDIPNYEPYQASSFGNIRMKLADGSYKLLKPFLNMDGYYQVAVKNCPTKLPNLHRLVAFAFHGVPKTKMVVDHLNNIHTDNRPENLEWVTQKENMRRAKAMGLYTKKTKIKCVEDNIIYESIADCAKKTGIRPASLWNTTRDGTTIRGKHYIRIEQENI